VRAGVQTEFSAVNLEYEISFLPSGEIVIKGISNSWHQKIDAILSSMKIEMGKKVKSLSLASSAILCAVDSNLNVTRKEDDHAGGGWSQVAKGALGGRAPVKQTVGAKSSFTVLGNKGLLKKKKEVTEEAVDDWEREVEGWDA
jgi:transcriptional repressor NF-X1